MMHPELATLLQRARTNRAVLRGLIDAIPPDYWPRRSEGDAWDALDHLRHVATVDELVVDLAEAAGDGARELWLAGTANQRDLAERRERLRESVSEHDPHGLVTLMEASREAAETAIGELPPASLEAVVRVAGVVTAWGEPQRFTLRGYLAAWAEHDGEHDRAIRRAIETAPAPSVLSLAARRPRR